MKKLRIAQITNLWESVPPQGKGGLEQMVSYLTEELVKRGHDVTLFGTGDSQTKAKLEAVWPEALSRDPYIPFHDKQTFAMWSVSEAFLQQEQFDIIHDHTYFVAGHFAGLLKTPVVSTMHHPVETAAFLKNFPDSYKPYLNKQFSHFEHMTEVTVSNYQANEHKLQTGRVAHVIHNGLNVEDWNKQSFSEGSYILFLGYITKNKGVAEAIQACLQAHEPLKIAGAIEEQDEESKRYFMDYVEPYIDGDNIQFLGKVDTTEKQSLFAGAKATLMPIQWDEPFGLVAIESLVSGTPVIAMNRGAMKEIITNGETGFIVETIEEMADAMKKIDQLSRKTCRERVEQHFSIKNMVDAYETLYQSILT